MPTLPPASHFLLRLSCCSSSSSTFSLNTFQPGAQPSTTQPTASRHTAAPELARSTCPSPLQAPPSPPFLLSASWSSCEEPPALLGPHFRSLSSWGFVSRAMPALVSPMSIWAPVWHHLRPLWSQVSADPCDYCGSFSLWAKAGSTWIYFLVGSMIF